MKKQIMAAVVLLGMMVAGSTFAELKDNNDGTVIDTQNGLVWLKRSDCFGKVNFFNAQNKPYGLQSGMCGLSDKSSAGQWRLPNVVELGYLKNNTSKFDGTITDWYWSSTTGNMPNSSKGIILTSGTTQDFGRDANLYVLPVRSAR